MTQILIRRGTAATWTSNNPVLGLGEIGYETDTKKAKMGDGSTTWNSLGYWVPTLPTGAVVGTTDSQTLTNKTISGASNTIQSVPTSALNLSGAATAYVAGGGSTTSTTYTDITTTTDQVTVTIGASGLALVSIVCAANWSGTGFDYAYTSFALSGANTMAASGQYSIRHNNGLAKHGGTFLLTGLTAGATTFKMKYATGSGTSIFGERTISVVPL